MLRSEVKEALLLVMFSFLLMDALTFTTIGFVVLGAVLVWLKIRPGKIIRNIITLVIFASYWITYGKVIDPEVGMNFLTTVIVLKMLEKETLRDKYMVFFGLLLIISAGSLFERTLTYVIFFGASFFILIQDFYVSLGLKRKMRDLGMAVLWVLPLTGLLFFITPRVLNPIPFQKGTPEAGEVGYTPQVNLSQVESLSSNDTPVFQALVSFPIPPDQLYWRGNTLSFNDGWNWSLMPSDRPSPNYANVKVLPDTREISQNIRVFTREEFFFTLDHPSYISFNDNEILPLRTKTVTQSGWQWIQRYEARSIPSSRFANVEDTRNYLRVGLKNNEKIWVDKTFSSTNLKGLSREIRDYIVKEKFTYSLSPGKISGFSEFMRSRRIGFCSHYSSSVAMILRQKGIPARLVSGFLGGNYNSYAEFYLVSQNDAHVWVEALDAGKWIRIDPTEWIAPDRVKLGGEAYMSSLANKSAFLNSSFMKNFGFLQDFKQWFSQWDFKFYRWLEQTDYYGQEAWLSRFNLKRKWLYYLLPICMLLFSVIFILFLKFQKRLAPKSMDEELWLLFLKKSRKRGLALEPVSLDESFKKLESFNHPDRDKLLNLWSKLVEVSFRAQTTEQLKGLKEDLKSL